MSIITREMLSECLSPSADQSMFTVFTGELLESIAQLTESEIDELQCELFEGEDDLEILSEAAGAMAGLPKHVVKYMTSQYVAPAGENSPTASAPTKGKTAAHVAITAGLNAHNHVIIKKGGEVIASVHPDRHGKEVSVLHGTGEKATHEKTAYSRASRRNGWRSNAHTYETSSHTRAAAIAKVHDAVHAAGGYGPDVEVHTVGSDANRYKVAGERRKARAEDYHSPHTDSNRQERAGLAVARKHAGSQPNGEEVKATATKLHAELATHIANGDHHNTIKTAEALAAHVSAHKRNIDNDSTEHAVRRASHEARYIEGKRTGDNYNAKTFVDKIRALKPKQ